MFRPQPFLYVLDVHSAYQQAVAAGATSTMPVSDMFRGDRYGKLTDPVGLATREEDVTPQEIKCLSKLELRA